MYANSYGNAYYELRNKATLQGRHASVVFENHQLPCFGSTYFGITFDNTRDETYTQRRAATYMFNDDLLKLAKN